MAAAGVQRLADMQLSDGGWGWFSGYRRVRLAAHHGRGRPRPAACQPERRGSARRACSSAGVAWLKSYQAKQVQLLQNGSARSSRTRSTPTTSTPWCTWSWSMAEFATTPCSPSCIATARTWPSTPRPCSAWRSRSSAKRTSWRWSCRTSPVRGAGRREPDGVPQAAERGLLVDWYGSEIEANAFYLKLLARTDPKGELAPAAGEVRAQQPQARDVLEHDPRHGLSASRPWPTT